MPEATEGRPLPERVAAAAGAFLAPVDESSLPARRRLTWRIGDAARTIIEGLVDTAAPDDQLHDVATRLEAIADALSHYEHGRRYEGWAEASTAGAPATSPPAGEPDGPAPAAPSGPPAGHLDFSPVAGRANPLAPPLVMHLAEGKSGELSVIGDVTFRSAYEGPPGCVHGGFVAAAFDEVLGATQALSGRPGMTGTLTVVYRAPTPLNRQLRFESRIDEVDGRKIHVSAELHSGEQLCAEASGIFISIDLARLTHLQQRRDGR